MAKHGRIHWQREGRSFYSTDTICSPRECGQDCVFPACSRDKQHFESDVAANNFEKQQELQGKRTEPYEGD